MIGKTISHYKIIEKLGSGGMGIVYKAEDSKLKRNVALKFLSPELTRDAEAKKRFIHEARAASALQHTNICTIHAIDETEDGQLFICMDYYKGETLKKKIDQRPLKLDDAINITVQIAQGLAKAHEAGIVHRDIKPANIIVTEDDEVKILDFGLVKLTGFTKLTKPGSTLGTTWYMSPEQLRGEKVDHRTDIWALGVVLYEMIAGQQPFKGEYEQAVSYAIMNDEPESITALRSGMPIALDSIISKALAKETKVRYQHVDELPADLARIETKPTGTSRITTPGVDASKEKQHSQWRWVIPWIIAGVMTLAAVFSFWPSEPSVQLSVKRAHINLPETAPLDPTGSAPFRIGQPAFTLSPDGANLVYVANSDGETHLYLRPMNGFEAVVIPCTRAAYAPFFSPDGKWVGFFAEDQLKIVDISGGRPSTLCEVTFPVGASWGSDNRIIFTQREGNVLSWIFADSRSSGTFSTNTATLWPEILPGGQAILSQTWSNDIKIFFTDPEREDILIEGPYSNPKYVSTGHIVCESEGKLVAIPFDLENLKVTGPPVPLIEEVRSETAMHAAQFAISSDGTLVYIRGSYQGNGQLFWVNSRGEEEALDFPFAEYTTFQISPNGERLAITCKDPDAWNVWIYDLISGNQNKLTMDGNNKDPVWMPDGNWITFESDRDGNSNLFKRLVEGNSDIKQLTKNTNKHTSFWGPSWSPDGKILAYEDVSLQNYDILLLSMDNNGITQPFAKTRFTEWAPVFSPDGRWIAYTSDEQGKYNVYVQPYPQTGEKWRISPENGAEPIWSRESDDIYYFMYDENVLKWMAVSYTDTPTFKPETPRALFKGDFLDIAGRGWDVSPIDQRFLLLKGGEDLYKTYTQLNVVTNWFEELKREMSQGN